MNLQDQLAMRHYFVMLISNMKDSKSSFLLKIMSIGAIQAIERELQETIIDKLYYNNFSDYDLVNTFKIKLDLNIRLNILYKSLEEKDYEM